MSTMQNNMSPTHQQHFQSQQPMAQTQQDAQRSTASRGLLKGGVAIGDGTLLAGKSPKYTPREEGSRSLPSTTQSNHVSNLFYMNKYGNATSQSSNANKTNTQATFNAIAYVPREPPSPYYHPTSHQNQLLQHGCHSQVQYSSYNHPHPSNVYAPQMQNSAYSNSSCLSLPPTHEMVPPDYRKTNSHMVAPHICGTILRDQLTTFAFTF